MFLTETKKCRDILVDLKLWLGYDGVFTVDHVGLSGGLAVFWKSGIKLDFKYADKNLIDMQVQYGEISFFLSCIYGEPSSVGKEIVWERLSRIGVCRKEKWCLIGDFNEILNNGEKTGGPLRSEASFQPFGDMLSVCGMEELESSGIRFTWAGQRWKKWIQCCLDRAFGNKAWRRDFPGSNQLFLAKRGSDHRPVLLKLQAYQDRAGGQFRFDKKFLFQPGVKQKIIEAWRGSAERSVNRSVAKRLRDCRGTLSAWKKERNFNARNKIQLLEDRLEWFQSRNYSCCHAIRVMKKELCRAYKEEELFWQQRSMEKWLKFGDRNSNFFHESVKGNRVRRRLIKIKNANGEEQWSEAAKAQVAVDYFSVLFKSSNPPSYQTLFQEMTPRVTEEMNQQLRREVSDEEIRSAVFSIKASSAPGPDGMSGLFFQQYWGEIGSKVTLEVKRFFERGCMPKDWNFTYLCLLPKIHEPESMADLRPISLCSVLYKIISKVMVGRLQPMLPDLISVNQSAFVAERLITDNIAIAHEAVHALRVHPTIMKENMVVKTDMSKAYDKVEWSYLRSLMEALGFDHTWVNLIMACITSVSFAVLINDQPFGMIKPQRGLRQGDPLSPFLFVLCTEGLTHLMNRAERLSLLQGLRFTDSGPSIHHLLFADDSLFICKATVSQAQTLHSVLQVYGRATGQTINLQKSAISFGSQIHPAPKLAIQGVLGILNEGGSSKYLGLPECFSGSKVELLSYLKERVNGRLNAWYLKKLSQGGKEILLKTTASALPVYPMSVFKLPKSICANISSVMAKFWWGSDAHRQKIHWIAWDKLCLPKESGGMGFRELEVFNQALLAKQAWKILTSPSCLLAQFLKSGYYPNSDFLEAKMGERPSFAWRSLLFGRDLLMKGLQKRVGDGNSICVWTDKWFEDEADGYGMRAPWIKNCTFDVNLRARDLIDFQNRRWNVEALEEVFVPSDIQLLLKNQPVTSKEDFWVWKFNKSGAYSVKSGYWLAYQEKSKETRQRAEALPSINPLKTQIWKVSTAPKIRLFVWKALSQALPVADLLIDRGMKCDDRCQLCGCEGESVNHVLFSCHLARKCWALSNIPSPRGGFSQGSLYQNMNYLLKMSKNAKLEIEITRCWPWILWYLWKSRNTFIFEGKSFEAEEIIKKAIDETEAWFLAQQVQSGMERAETEVATRDLNCPKQSIPAGWVLCEFDMDWSKHSQEMGVAWIVREESGKVLMHSRRAFSNIKSVGEAKLQVWMWVLESMKSLKKSKVIFLSTFGDFVEAIKKPGLWPVLQFEAQELKRELQAFEAWELRIGLPASVRCASFIAQSVRSLGLYQSYVAIGHPRWLDHLYSSERNSSVV
ncbi:uncharacterized protein LOC108807498 [Raphanus sativus]|uniref:Uncharacterized protein LOC108807498 n=1 Tax=Raphanus sativus TaxID=3726 RepID=A0A6J0JJV4_RAPSA|nr:uncharacterized protein LOC108807498 [Raphanus sativus]